MPSEITGREGSHSDVVAFIREARRRKIVVQVGVIDCGVNEGRLWDTCKFAESLGVTHIVPDRVRNTGSGKKYTENGYPTFPSLSPQCAGCLNTHVCIDADGTVIPCALQGDHPLGNIRETTLQEVLSSDTRKRTVKKLAAVAATLSPTEPLITEEDCRARGELSILIGSDGPNICPASFASCCAKPQMHSGCH